MKKIFLIVIFLYGVSYTQTLQSINSGGAQMTQSNGSLNFTVGELIILTQIDSLGNTLNNGFISTSSLVITNISEVKMLSNINIFPNPTSEIIFINLNLLFDFIQISFVDLNGIEIYNAKYNNISNSIKIDISTYPIGIYTLFIKTNNEIIQTFKIIKN